MPKRNISSSYQETFATVANDIIFIKNTLSEFKGYKPLVPSPVIFKEENGMLKGEQKRKEKKREKEKKERKKEKKEKYIKDREYKETVICTKYKNSACKHTIFDVKRKNKNWGFTFFVFY